MPASERLSAEANRLAAVALSHVRREYPYSPGHVLAGPEDARTPRALHPIFYGSFDWHSSVHTHWTLARLLRRFPDAPFAAGIAAFFDEQFTPAKVAAECAYLAAPSARGFERPYGWGWLLKLAEELMRHENERWARNLGPLAGHGRRALHRFPAARDLSDSAAAPFQQRLRFAARRRLRRGRGRRKR